MNAVCLCKKFHYNATYQNEHEHDELCWKMELLKSCFADASSSLLSTIHIFKATESKQQDKTG